MARELLGCTVEVAGVAGRIVETEAYTTDAASHAVTNRERGRLMRETAGRVYVYLIYGIYACLNFTTDVNGPGAVLIRALEPVAGLDLMRERHGRNVPVQQLANGPGKLCRALAIDTTFNGGRIHEPIRIFAAEQQVEVATSPRIGITKAVDLPWRFYVPGNKSVSRFLTAPKDSRD